jgi:hypothetical protein
MSTYCFSLEQPDSLGRTISSFRIYQAGDEGEGYTRGFIVTYTNRFRNSERAGHRSPYCCRYQRLRPFDRLETREAGGICRYGIATALTIVSNGVRSALTALT